MAQSLNMAQQQAGESTSAYRDDVVLTPMSFDQFQVPEIPESMQQQESDDDAMLIPSDSGQPHGSSPGISAIVHCV